MTCNEIVVPHPVLPITLQQFIGPITTLNETGSKNDSPGVATGFIRLTFQLD